MKVAGRGKVMKKKVKSALFFYFSFVKRLIPEIVNVQQHAFCFCKLSFSFLLFVYHFTILSAASLWLSVFKHDQPFQLWNEGLKEFWFKIIIGFLNTEKRTEIEKLDLVDNHTTDPKLNDRQAGVRFVSHRPT